MGRGRSREREGRSQERGGVRRERRQEGEEKGRSEERVVVGEGEAGDLANKRCKG